ncbi:MAG TPA: hypothetical protein VGP84_06120 [Gemmatimonadaceae bacterium]|jgi:hypothetical protein|nr:hypothetical protein [Gemmatimonadaceae bacterium]
MNGERQTPFFAVSTRKFVVMSIVTLGLYDVYWVWRQWRRFVEHGQVLSPFWRTFFLVFTNYSLFARVRSRAREEGIEVSWSPALMATLYLVLNVTWRLPDPWVLVSLLVFVPLIPIQETIERINARHVAELPNRGFSGADAVAIVIGGLVLILVLIGVSLG